MKMYNIFYADDKLIKIVFNNVKICNT